MRWRREKKAKEMPRVCRLARRQKIGYTVIL